MIIVRFKTYTEVSPSGTGIRMFLRGTLPPTGRKKGQTEVYSDKKFVSVTGNRLNAYGDKVVDRSAELLMWHRETFGITNFTKKSNGDVDVVVNVSASLDERRLAELFLKKPKAKELYNGTRNGYASQSEADLGLASYAAHAQWQPQEICDLLVAARTNADEPIKALDYFVRTIDKASDGIGTRASAPPSFVASLTKMFESNVGDEVAIGTEGYEASDEHNTATWEDVAKKVEGIKWMVPKWLPYGMLVGIIAEPKIGKSGFVLGALAKPIITGSGWFNGSLGAEAGYVVYCDTEHSAAINLDRAKKWGLPLDRIVAPFQDPLMPINLDDNEHMLRIANVVCKYQAKLVVVDSFRGAHDGDENNSTIVKPLRTLGLIAESTGTTICLIHHTKKLTIGEDITPNCGRGSNAFLAAVRCQIAIDRPDPKSEWRRVQVLGENLGVTPNPIGFRFAETGLEFGPAPKRISDDASRAPARAEAEQWLLDLLKDGPVPAADVWEKADVDRLNEATLKNAKKSLGIESKKMGGPGGSWMWLPPSTKKN